jgi:hypothetical protein
MRRARRCGISAVRRFLPRRHNFRRAAGVLRDIKLPRAKLSSSAFRRRKRWEKCETQANLSQPRALRCIALHNLSTPARQREKILLSAIVDSIRRSRRGALFMRPSPSVYV